MHDPYAPPKEVSPPAVPTNEFVVPINGVDGVVSVLPGAGLFSVGTLLLDGRPLSKSGRHGYPLPMRDGTTVLAQLRQSWKSPVPIVVLYGRKYEVGPKIGAPYLVLIFLPFALVFVGVSSVGSLAAWDAP